MIDFINKNYNLLLASKSPRRHHFLKQMGLNFKIVNKEVEEIFPPELKKQKITNYLAQLKASPFVNELEEKEILITSDTIVWHQNKAFGKPKNKLEAAQMLHVLSGKSHEVITSICLSNNTSNPLIEYCTTKVWFNNLNHSEIDYYLKTNNALDKAGAYGIQDWIGLIGVSKIEGSFNNVVGLPTHLLYKMLKKSIDFTYLKN